jgi:uroporphyrinogen decarboxylase
MNHRERYLACVNRQSSDRPALDLMGTASGLTDGVYQQLRQRLAPDSAERMFRKGQNVKFYNEAVLEALGIDARRVWLRQLPEETVAADDALFTDMWGVGHTRCGNHVQQVDWPLQDATIADLDRYPWPDVTDPRLVHGLREEARRLRDEGAYAVVGRSPTSGFFEVGCALRRMDRYMMDLVDAPDFVEALNAKIVELQIALYGHYLDACGEYLDVIETGDDYGSSQGPLISPACFRAQLKPYRARLNNFIKSKAPHIKIFHHTCGNVWKLIPDLIDVGIDILNPVQPVAGMEPVALVREFGKDICFLGGVDTIHVLRGSVEEVRRSALKLRRAFAGGSWIAAPANHVQDDVPAENIQAFYETLGTVSALPDDSAQPAPISESNK